MVAPLVVTVAAMGWLTTGWFSWTSESTVASAASGAVMESTEDMGFVAATTGPGAGAVAEVISSEAATAGATEPRGEGAAQEHSTHQRHILTYTRGALEHMVSWNCSRQEPALLHDASIMRA